MLQLTPSICPNQYFKNMKLPSPVLYFFFVCLTVTSPAVAYDGPRYDFTAYSECKLHPEKPLYNGGILKEYSWYKGDNSMAPTFRLQNLNQGSFYSFSTWVKTSKEETELVRASLIIGNESLNCIGSVLARKGCWSFLKGGFVFNSQSNIAMIQLKSSQDTDIHISVASSSLQPFTQEQWRSNQDDIVNQERKRTVTVHVCDSNGAGLEGVELTIHQESKDFPIGSAISKNILGNFPYQRWFTERFNAAVFENELKWYATEHEPGKVNYTIADQMLEFVRANQIIARGHNIFWEDPRYTPQWVRNLTDAELHSAVKSRIRSLMQKYKDEFVHWDVSNELLHFDFYEQRLGPNATLSFYETTHRADPLATLFMNEYNVIETCSDGNSTVDTYISRLRELGRYGIKVNGIGLEGHFTVPNPPLIRGILDKFATLGLPVWLTEVDISKKLGQKKQAVYLEQVLREGFSHPSVTGIMMWTALDPKGCYQMCLTDNDFNNLPAGDTVDKLLKEWQTGELKGKTDGHGSFSFDGFLGEYKVTAKYEQYTVKSVFSLSRGTETKHFSIQI